MRLPSLTYPDFYTYLAITRSAYANDQMNSYKGLQAYNWMDERESR